MSRVILMIFREWSWKDYLQLFNSAAFCLFGGMILFHAGLKGTVAGYMIGSAFLGFGIYRLRYYAAWFLRAAGK